MTPQDSPIWNGAPAGEAVVAMIEFQGKVFVATSFHVWELRDGRLHPLIFVSQPEGIAVEVSPDDPR